MAESIATMELTVHMQVYCPLGNDNQDLKQESPLYLNLQTAGLYGAIL
jgi:hypothetical protein